MQHLLRLATDSYSRCYTSAYGCGKMRYRRRSIRANKQQVHKFTFDAFAPNEQMSASTRGMKKEGTTYDMINDI